ncbi:MAG: four helix bundle protein [Anaerolineae bacterium]|nr:MAG: four helix bundle protein [Anaerolineae bacterium]WKZ45966.1 MAG: four helix bundle protein [Anaerolineales bacterium]
MAIAKSHRELRVYQLAFESATQIYEVTKKFPSEEKFSLTDQIRRSSRSVCANIAEAWRRRKYPKNFVSKLTDSDSEATETSVWLDFALHFGYLTNEQHKKLADHYDHICSQLSIMMSQPNKWMPRTDE